MREFSFTVIMILLFHGISFSQAKSVDYAVYHQRIIAAENKIFMENDSIEGLKQLKEVFDNYNFVFVDDCIEAFQLALAFKRDDYALRFIKKAIENGFEPSLLDKLSYLSYNENTGLSLSKVTIYKPFMEKHGSYLQKYTDTCFDKYVQRIDKQLLAIIIKRHMKEQLYKDYHTELGMSERDQTKAYHSINDDNMHFMDSLARINIFLGEQNLGILTDRLVEKLHFVSLQKQIDILLTAYNVKKRTPVPIVTEASYFETNPVYTIMFHCPHSFNTIAPYKDEAIRRGYLHPREYAYLQFNYSDAYKGLDLYLNPTSFDKLMDTTNLGVRRKKLSLSGFEMDYQKYEFAKKHNLQLFFGFFNATR